MITAVTKVRNAKALSVQDIAKELGVSETTVRSWIASKALRAIQLDGSRRQPIIRVFRDDLLRFLQSRETIRR